MPAVFCSNIEVFDLLLSNSDLFNKNVRPRNYGKVSEWSYRILSLYTGMDVVR